VNNENPRFINNLGTNTPSNPNGSESLGKS